MPLSAEEVDKQTSKLIRRVIVKFTKDKKKWSMGWKRSELLTDGYSERIVAKAKEYGAKEANSTSSMICWMFICLLNAFCQTGMQWMWSLIAIFSFGSWIYGKRRYGNEKLSYDENLLVLEELTKRLGPDLGDSFEIPEEHPLLESWSRRLEKRAILWRLDAFLSRKPINH